MWGEPLKTLTELTPAWSGTGRQGTRHLLVVCTCLYCLNLACVRVIFVSRTTTKRIGENIPLQFPCSSLTLESAVNTPSTPTRVLAGLGAGLVSVDSCLVNCGQCQLSSHRVIERIIRSDERLALSTRKPLITGLLSNTPRNFIHWLSHLPVFGSRAFA